MLLQDLHIIHYKNLKELRCRPDSGFNYIVGNNGMGKTNLLDAIYFSAFGRSYFSTRAPSELIHFDEDFLRIEMVFRREGKEEKLVLKMPATGKRIIEREGRLIRQISEHIGYIPVVFITPDDGFILLSASAERRRWMDRSLSMMNRHYLLALKAYNKLLKHRNALLKNTSYGRDITKLLDTYNAQMAPHAHTIFQSRREFIEQIRPLIKSYYHKISEEKETIDLRYQSQLQEESLEELAPKSYQKDLLTGRSGTGTHKDDLLIHINSRAIKRFASQGQLKSFVLALKMAQYRFLSDYTKKKPLLLIDDIFAKLDAERVHALIDFLRDSSFGQVFITDTDPHRMKRAVERLEGQCTVFQMNEGRLDMLSY